MFKLAGSKGNWGAKYDRLEHFKRFSNLKRAITELSKNRWVKVKQKSNYTGISLNPEFKREIIEFIKREMPYVKERLK